MCVCVCVFVRHGWPDYEVLATCLRASVRSLGSMCVYHGWTGFESCWPFCLVKVCEGWGQYVCVMDGQIKEGFGHFVLCKCARLGINVCVCVSWMAGF